MTKALFLTDEVVVAGNDQRRLMELVDAGRIAIAKAGVQHLTIQHDNYCKRMRNKGACNCQPTIDGIEWGE